jgi:hypothetical protein
LQDLQHCYNRGPKMAPPAIGLKLRLGRAHPPPPLVLAHLRALDDHVHSGLRHSWRFDVCMDHQQDSMPVSGHCGPRSYQGSFQSCSTSCSTLSRHDAENLIILLAKNVNGQAKMTAHVSTLRLSTGSLQLPLPLFQDVRSRDGSSQQVAFAQAKNET